MAALQQQPQCMSLMGSTACPDFNDYQIWYPGNQEVVPAPFEPNVLSFDAFIQAQADDNPSYIAQFQQAYGCPGYKPGVLRYHLTVLCGIFVDQATRDRACNPSPPSQLICKDSAQAFLDSLTSTFANSAVCQAAVASGVKEARDDVVATVKRFVEFDGVGGASNGCVSAMGREKEGCGWYDETKAKTVCAGVGAAGMACCQSGVGNVASPTETLSSSSSSSSLFSVPASTRSAVTSSSDFRNKPEESATDIDGASAGESTASATILGVSQPVFIGAVGGGIVFLVAVIIAISMAVTKGRRRRASVANGATTTTKGSSKFNSPGATGLRRRSMSPVRGGARGVGEFGAAGNSTGAPIPLPPGIGGGGMGNGYGTEGVGNSSVAETMEVVFNYVPNLSDEIYLYVGDPVIVKCKFDDGWGYGFNMTTKMEGSFPLACVAAYNSEGQTRGSDWLDGAGKNVNRASFSIRQRESSMYGPPAGFDLASNYDGGDQQQHDYRASQFTMDTQY